MENTKIAGQPAADMPKGTWVAQFADHDTPRPLIGKVIEAYTDHFSGAPLLDIVIYSKTGEKVGRESPACGGPKGFEPACPAESWEPIEKPDFSFIADKFFYGRLLTRLRFVDADTEQQEVIDD